MKRLAFTVVARRTLESFCSFLALYALTAIGIMYVNVWYPTPFVFLATWPLTLGSESEYISSAPAIWILILLLSILLRQLNKRDQFSYEQSQKVLASLDEKISEIKSASSVMDVRVAYKESLCHLSEVYQLLGHPAEARSVTAALEERVSEMNQLLTTNSQECTRLQGTWAKLQLEYPKVFELAENLPKIAEFLKTQVETVRMTSDLTDQINEQCAAIESSFRTGQRVQQLYINTLGDGRTLQQLVRDHSQYVRSLHCLNTKTERARLAEVLAELNAVREELEALESNVTYLGPHKSQNISIDS